MTNPAPKTPAQEADEASPMTKATPRTPAYCGSSIMASDYLDEHWPTIRQALALLHSVQSAEAKVLAREPTAEMFAAGYNGGKITEGRTKNSFRQMWDAAPSTPPVDGGKE